MQPTVMTSSTETEFIAAVYTAKAIKHLCSILTDLNLKPSGPTIIYKDKKAAINMINNCKPTTCFHHIDIQHFAIQEWQNQGNIRMHHIPGILNPADNKMKALSWLLHSQHSCQTMGHFGPSE